MRFFSLQPKKGPKHAELTTDCACTQKGKPTQDSNKQKRAIKFFSPVNHSTTKQMLSKYKMNELEDIKKRIEDHQKQLNQKKQELYEEK